MGYLSQEPQLDPDKDVRGNVMEGVAAKQALVDRFNEIANNYSDETADEMARLGRAASRELAEQAIDSVFVHARIEGGGR